MVSLKNYSSQLTFTKLSNVSFDPLAIILGSLLTCSLISVHVPLQGIRSQKAYHRDFRWLKYF